MKPDDMAYNSEPELAGIMPTQIPRIDVRSLSQEAYNHIKRLILTGVFKDGEKIPEEKIASILNVSRTPIREALRQLEQYGLVDIKPRSYAKVASVTVEEARQIATVRAHLEELSVKLLVENPDRLKPNILFSLANQAVERLDQGIIAEAYLLDSAFHLEVTKQTGNQMLYSILDRLDAKNQLVRIRASMPVERYRAYLLEHLEIVRLLSSRELDKILTILQNHITPKQVGS